MVDMRHFTVASVDTMSNPFSCGTSDMAISKYTINKLYMYAISTTQKSLWSCGTPYQHSTLTNIRLL